ncbi:MAG: hypothetical protein IPI61_01260 [Syntrophaceae bacterium]|jgi:hypothetical protein|nr:hypothetical protein [Syntrophaceae bacterium]MBP7034083.1 hypothetical protein [Syntrophobacterales bacterium]HNU85935.1 hypothetical protein [Syntrophales bacterium]HOH45294.1 hypothetical protein [Syntrophales bacterium]HOR33294.1 hypothetical protein [Syntrophales bacterium]
MKERFGDRVDVQIHLTDSEEAMKCRVRSATSVMVNGEWVPLDIALSEERMASFLGDRVMGA